METLPETIILVSNTIAKATQDSLAIEVIASALLAIKEQPELSIKEALNIGLKEWDVENV